MNKSSILALVSITLADWSCSDQMGLCWQACSRKVLILDFFLPLEIWKAEMVVHSYKEDYFSNSYDFTPIFTSSIKSKITSWAASYCTMTSHFPLWKCLFTFQNKLWKHACSKTVYFDESERRNERSWQGVFTTITTIHDFLFYR